MTRWPIRTRVAVAFGAAMAIVLALTGLFVYLRLSWNLTQTLNENLRLRADDVRALVERTGGTLADEDRNSLIERGESFAQLIAADGRILDGSTGLEGSSLLDRDELSRALRQRQLFLDRPSAPMLDEPVRLLATPVEARGGRAVLVVGVTSENRRESLADLRNSLLIAGPLALLLTTLIGHRLAGVGLGAVEAMRRRAAEISATTPGERLPVPPTRDELERLGDTLNEMLERLEEALARERGFVADAGHELRTPLALLRAELDLALRDGSTEAELRDALRLASDETDRLVQLAGDLLLIASADQGKLALRREQLSADALFSGVRNRFLLRARETGRELVTEPGAVMLTGDRLRLEQALGNLVDNALRHGDGDVDLTATAGDGAVVLRVADQGEGFPAGFQESAFERFSRPDRGRSGGGSGLGLSIVRAIAEAHGGSAALADTAHGAAVTITLPAVPD
ncbi:MAG: ATP-binding protein [Gaiellales bacterium]